MALQLISSSLGWISTKAESKARHALISVLSAGPVPKHVAFILDGNRRYARSKHKAIKDGHYEGFWALRKMLEVCMNLGVKCVSAYVFSIENFKRSPEEVEALMDLAEEKLLEFARQGEILDKYGIRLVVVGRWELLPERVQVAARKALDRTQHNENRAIFNMCFPYTSREEIANAVQETIRERLEDDSLDEKITVEDLEAHLRTAGSPPLDILIRTSGVKRLSDYMLWQCSEDTQIQFSSKYWPDFGFWDFIPIILDYQRKVWATQP
ncbi:dehydrodolichyl diphosphate synthetase [Dichomitus squalens LYAD-421 SS1]|uniref:dehydrodolichyl diphosphate synthetase n=1 Tax=Dichomitus squalens (strain LYAD-421) TaxID=732165 RepID=UPI00044151E3|nr:dehydrodolichyl diphosphate synthetase [Dichomitus squalens LYAD-421 SS1]EJF66045.1 dehydrodolichyl diphosphate synthetase [Dichomitus squalens LYAD-421 SS1]